MDMNWWVIVAVVSAFLLGWGIGIWRGVAKGYDAAIQEQQEKTAQEMWSNFIQQFQGGNHGR